MTPVYVSGKSSTLRAIQLENVLYKTGEEFISIGNITSFRLTQLPNIVCCRVLPFGILIFSRFLHPSKVPASYFFIFVKCLNEEKSLILVLSLNIVPMEPLPKRSSYLLINRCVFHRRIHLCCLYTLMT